MDEVFGEENFYSMIHYRALSPLGVRGISNVYDYVVWYARDKQRIKYRNIQLDRPVSDEPEFVFVDDGSGSYVRTSEITRESENKVFKRSDLKSSGYTPTCIYDFDLDGVRVAHTGRKSWRTNKEGMERTIRSNRLLWLGSSVYFRQYFRDSPMKQLENTWTDTAAGFYGRQKVYVVQTNDKVIAALFA